MGSGASTWLAILAGGPGGEEIRFVVVHVSSSRRMASRNLSNA